MKDRRPRVWGSDAARRDYLRRCFDVDEWLLPDADLVVDADVISVDQTAHLVWAHASS